MMLEKKKDVRKTFISLVAVALFLALVLVLDQVNEILNFLSNMALSPVRFFAELF